jgi:hypothetical protein
MGRRLRFGLVMFRRTRSHVGIEDREARADAKLVAFRPARLSALETRYPGSGQVVGSFSRSKPRKCLRCSEPVKLQPGRETCARCCDAMEYGAATK